MTVVFALAAAFAAAGAASSQVVVRVRPPSAPALRASVLPAASFSPPAPSLSAVRLLGTPGPGVTPAHIEAIKAVAAKGQAVFVHGSRQTGVSYHTGLPFSADSDLNTGVIGAWDGRVRVPSIEEAVGRGYLVAAPALPKAALAHPWRTAEQLSRLAASPRLSGESFRFAVIGDAEPGRFWISRKLFNSPGVFWKLLAGADRSGSDFILQLGDMVSRGTVSNFLGFVRGLFAAGPRTPYLTVIGNHDRHKPHGVTNDRVYRAVFGGTDYYFERAGRRFVVVDSSAGRVTRAQLAWLAGVLTPGAVVFTHIPPAPLSEWTDWGRFKGAGGFKEGSGEFMRLMTVNRVERVYMGHIHGLGVLERGGVRYVLTGGGGSPLFPGPVKKRLHHWLSVDVGPEGIVETVHAADGSSFLLK